MVTWITRHTRRPRLRTVGRDVDAEIRGPGVHPDHFAHSLCDLREVLRALQPSLGASVKWGRSHPLRGLARRISVVREGAWLTERLSEGQRAFLFLNIQKAHAKVWLSLLLDSLKAHGE